MYVSRAPMQYLELDYGEGAKLAPGHPASPALPHPFSDENGGGGSKNSWWVATPCNLAMEYVRSTALVFGDPVLKPLQPLGV